MVAVDSSVIIHLARIGRLHLLQTYFKKIRITKGVEQEIVGYRKAGSEEIKRCIGKWIEVEKAGISTETDTMSVVDKEIIELAKKKKDLILTNDETIILFAKSRSVETMWLTTFLILCLKRKFIDKKESKQILYDLVKHGCYIRTDTFITVQKIIEEM